MLSNEQDLVPYSATPLRGEKLLVLAPHPDDEIIGCGGLVRQHVRELRQVKVVVVTDGAAASTSADPAAYRQRREKESRAGLDLLGVTDVTFLGLPDRGLAAHSATLKEQITGLLISFAPDLVVVPSPAEIHPDHAALASAFIESVQENPQTMTVLPLTRVAFCEISQPIRPNTLVDISDVFDQKMAALRKHESQMELRDYSGFADGLNRYRTMTLPDARAAEAFWVTDLRRLASTPLSGIRSAVSGGEPIYVTESSEPVSVIVRTKDRLPWLREAVESIRANRYPGQIVVVNDGGESPAASLTGLPGLQLIEHATSRGRAEAMNSGVRAATSDLIAFLDDDDLFYPEHLSTLARAIGASGRRAIYSDAVSTFLTMREDGSYLRGERMRMFEQDFDPELLLADNYIPLTTLMTARSDFLDAGGFDPAFDLFEDWDFLIRLSSRGPFQRVPRVTCEVRHFPSGGSAVLALPEGSAGFREAKLKVWNKHRALMTNDLFATVFERQKSTLRRTGEQSSTAVGQAAHLALDVQRLERDKVLLIAEIREIHGKYAEVSTDKGALIHQLEQRRTEAAEAAALHDDLRTRHDDLIARHQSLSNELDAARVEIERLGLQVSQLEEAVAEEARRRQEIEQSAHQSATAMLREIERLNSILNQIYASKTWKLHRLADTVRGR